MAEPKSPVTILECEKFEVVVNQQTDRDRIVVVFELKDGNAISDYWCPIKIDANESER